MNRLRKRLIDRRLGAREGKRFIAFYRGARDCRAAHAVNPYPPGSKEAGCWEAGWKYRESEQRESTPPPVCRFGPGGDFVRDWPEENP